MDEGVRQSAILPAHLMAGLVTTALVLFAAFSLAVPPVRVTVSPRIAIAPADILVTVRVQRDPANRGLYVMANDDRLSFVQLDGENAPAIIPITWKAVPAGEYQIVAAVFSSTALLAQAVTTLKVRE